MARSIEHYRRLLPINKHYLDDDLEQQSTLLEEISREVGRLADAAVMAKEELAYVDAKTALEIKRQHEKVTAADVLAMVAASRAHKDAFNNWRAAEREHKSWSSLEHAWRSRGFDMHKLGDLYSHSYFAHTTNSVGAITRKNRDAPRDEPEQKTERVKLR